MKRSNEYERSDVCLFSENTTHIILPDVIGLDTLINLLAVAKWAVSNANIINAELDWQNVCVKSV